MNIHEYMEKMKIIQNCLINFLNDDDEKSKENYNKLVEQIFPEFQGDVHKIKSIIYLVMRIANNHHRCQGFFPKIFQILTYFKSNIKQIFTNDEIFKLFKGNKRILLFLVEENILSLDESVISIIDDKKYEKYRYREYFFPEQFENKETNEYFDEQKKIGENESDICKMIRDDNIDEFVIYVNKTNYPLSSTINPSKFETNQFLIKNKPTLIEYSAFFGSIQIFQYLYMNNVTLTSSLWIYAIHSNKPEMISFLEEKKVDLSDFMINDCCKESIKCHHNEIYTYIHDNYIGKDYSYTLDKKFSLNDFRYGFHYCNYFIFFDDVKNTKFFYYACKYDYFDLFMHFINDTDIDINEYIYEIGNFYTAISLAYEKGNKEIVECLLSNPKFKIGKNCFNGNQKLKQFDVPSSITSIGENSFCNCKSLIQVTIPISVTSIESYAFFECSSLKEIIIPSSVTNIGPQAFSRCKSLTSIVIPSSVSKIDKKTFCVCQSLIKIDIPSSVTDIESYAFSGCFSLSEVNLPPSVKNIGTYCFENCSITTIVIPNSIKSIKEGTFYQCSKLQKISIPSSVTSIERKAFSECTSLAEVEFINPSSIASIGESSFEHCRSLLQINIPSSVTSIRPYAFGGCYSLDKSKIPISFGDDIFNVNKTNGRCVIH